MIAAALLAFALAGEEPQLPPADTWTPQHGARLRVLDKIQSTVETVNIAVGQSATIGAIRIAVGGCFTRPPELPSDATAKLTITDTGQGNTLFDGWMLVKEPAIGVMEHPVYDVQLAGCS